MRKDTRDPRNGSSSSWVKVREGTVEPEAAARGEYGVILPACVGPLRSIHSTLTASETERRAGQAVVEAFAYRVRHGRFPDRLEELGGKPFLVDPFSGDSFRYRRDGDSFLLYTVGKNARDDGGEARPALVAEDGDFIFWPRTRR